MLHVPLERTGAVNGIIGLVSHEVPGLGRKIQSDLAFGQTLAQMIKLQFHNLRHLVASERQEEHGLVNTVQELRPEVILQFVEHLFLGARIQISVLINAVQEVLGPDVGRHNDDRIAEVHGMSLAVCQTAVIQHLQEDVEHIGMGLLDLIEQHHRVRLPAHGLGELAAFLKAHVSWRCADEPGHGELLHVLAHIDTHDVVLGIEEGFGQSLGELSLAHAGGAEEEEGSGRSVRVGEAGTGAQHGISHGLDCLILSHDTAVQLVAQLKQLVAFGLKQAGHRDAGPLGHDLCDIVGTDFLAQEMFFLTLGVRRVLEFLLQTGQRGVGKLGRPAQVACALGLLYAVVGLLDFGLEGTDAVDIGLLLLPLGLQSGLPGAQFGQLIFKLAESLLGGVIVFLAQGLTLDFKLHDLAVRLIEFCGLGVNLRTDHGAGLIDEIDGLVGKLTVRNVTAGEHNGLDQCGIADTHTMVHFKAFLQAAQDGDGVLDARLVDHDGLEPALKGGILLDVLAVLINGCCADAVQFASGQHGLKQVARVHGAFGLARADNGMQLVDEEDDLSLTLFDFLQNGLETFLELTAVLGTGDERTHIKSVELVSLEVLGYVALENTESQAFHNGRLANAGLTDEDGVVLGAAGQDADHAADFLVTADDRIELAVPGVLDEIPGILGESLHGLLGVGARHMGAAAQFLHGLHEVHAGDFVLGEHPAKRRIRRLIGQRAEEMVNADVLVLHALCLVLGFLDDLGETLGDHDFAGIHARSGHGRPLAQHLFQGNIESLHMDAHTLQDIGNNTLVLADQGQREVACVNFLMAHARGNALRFADGLTRLVGKFFDVHSSSGLPCPLWAVRPCPSKNQFSSKPCRLLTCCSSSSMRSRRSTMMVPPTTGSPKSQQMRSSLRTRYTSLPLNRVAFSVSV